MKLNQKQELIDFYVSLNIFSYETILKLVENLLN